MRKSLVFASMIALASCSQPQHSTAPIHLFKIGDKVIIDHLVHNTEFNGCTGYVNRYLKNFDVELSNIQCGTYSVVGLLSISQNNLLNIN